MITRRTALPMGIIVLVLANAGSTRVWSIAPSHQDTCAVRVQTNGAKRWVRLAGEDVVSVRLVRAGRASPARRRARPIAGKLEPGAHGYDAFHPRFSLTPGLRHIVEGPTCRQTFVVPETPPRTPKVVDIYPRAKAVPENILRFYIYFSEPMADGHFLRHLRLLDLETEEELSGVFFDNVHELWSRDRRRITLLVDPGRVKTGLQANIRQGRAFKVGHRYQLKVLPTWRSLENAPLEGTFVATYEVVPERRKAVDATQWVLETSSAQRRSPLVVDFNTPVDHVSVYNLLNVLTARNQRVPGAWTLDPGDTVARFVPRSPWPEPGTSYELRVHGRFEDIAGNNLAAAFDHSVGDVERGSEGRVVTLPFVRAPHH